jgi:hypothetical protein
MLHDQCVTNLALQARAARDRCDQIDAGAVASLKQARLRREAKQMEARTSDSEEEPLTERQHRIHSRVLPPWRK